MTWVKEIRAHDCCHPPVDVFSVNGLQTGSIWECDDCGDRWEWEFIGSPQRTGRWHLMNEVRLDEESVADRALRWTDIGEERDKTSERTALIEEVRSLKIQLKIADSVIASHIREESRLQALLAKHQTCEGGC